MSRVIVVDTDTSIGYLYLTKQFYIINKNTYTFRSTEELAKQVLNIVAPDNTVTIQDLANIKETNEVLTSLSYTLHDTGAYVSSIQINDYSTYPIVLDCYKQVIYIKGTDIVFNLTVNESRESRIYVIMNFFLDTLGVEITMEQLTLIYNYLISMYTPYVYNVISDTSTSPILYSNVFAISNWNNKSKAEYSCTLNPYDTYTKTHIGDIIEVSPSLNTVYILNYAGGLTSEDTVYIEGATTSETTYSYSADGEYVVQNIDTFNDITGIRVTNALASSYTFPYPKAYKQLATTNIVSINREAGTITLASDVSDLITDGDVVEVTNTQVAIEGTTVSCNGTYTVASISGDTITVQGTLPTNYTYTDQPVQGVLSKNIFIGNVKRAATVQDETTLRLTTESPVTMSSLDHIFVEETLTNNITVRTYFTVQSVEAQDRFTCITASYTGTTPFHTYTPVYPELQTRTPDTNILIEVTDTSNSNVFPTGEFMVDNFEQCREYIGLYTGLAIPSYEVYNRINQEVGGDVIISDALPACTYLGVFSQVYTDENNT